MKKSIALLAALTLFTACPTATLPTAHAEAGSYSSVMYQGMRSEDVTQLQQDLETLGYYTYPSITGYFGSVTKTAVVAFQTDYGLKADGIVGSRTATEIAHALVKKEIVDDTYNYLNIPYLWGGSDPSTGFDCSGFIYYMFSRHDVEMDRATSSDLYRMGKEIGNDQLRPGDLVFFSIERTSNVSHVGIYTGNGKFISPLRSKGIYVQSMVNNSYWTPRYLGARRIY